MEEYMFGATFLPAMINLQQTNLQAESLPINFGRFVAACNVDVPTYI